jgi:PhnB protein
MPLADQFWGDYYGAVTDRFGVQWMINHNPQGTAQ